VFTVQEAEEQLQQKGFLSFWSSKRYEHAKMLIFLFQVSHILVCCQVAIEKGREQYDDISGFADNRIHVYSVLSY